MKKILYVSRFAFGDDAPGFRVKRVGKLMQMCGCEVHFLSMNKECKFDESYKLCNVYEENNKKTKILNTMANNIDFFTSRITYHYVKKSIVNFDPDVIVLYNDIGNLTKLLLKYCKNRNIKLGADVTEWYEIPKKYSKIRFMAKSVNNRINNIDENMDFILAISPYLTEYYKRKKCLVYEIPPLMDEVKMWRREHYDYKDGSKLNLSYAGSPGQKDLIAPLVSAVDEINKEKILVHLDLIGISEEDITEDLHYNTLSKSGICTYGRVAHDAAINILSKADYTVLLRENLRYAKAGFSTKFAESLSMGIPVVCNEVGGADSLIHDNNVGILMKDYSVDTIVKTVRRLLLEDSEKLKSMKNQAVILAEKMMSMESYKELYVQQMGDIENDS